MGPDFHRIDDRPLWCVDSLHARMRQGVRQSMTFETIVAFVLALLALIYLLYALLRPENL